MIDTFLSTYNDRKKELNGFIDLLKFLEKKSNNRNESGISEFDTVFHNGEDSISFTYQQLINVLKSNASLMIYSIIEFTVANLLESIYDEIKVRELSYIEVSDSIRRLWRESILKAGRDPNANFYTFLRKNEVVINAVVLGKIVEIKAKQTIPDGNLDGLTIQKTFAAHGIQIATNSDNYRPDLLESIKKSRNELAHGSVSFVDALRQKSILDIGITSGIVISFLDELIDLVQVYINEQKYAAGTKSY